MGSCISCCLPPGSMPLEDMPACLPGNRAGPACLSWLGTFWAAGPGVPAPSALQCLQGCVPACWIHHLGCLGFWGGIPHSQGCLPGILFWVGGSFWCILVTAISPFLPLSRLPACLGLMPAAVPGHFSSCRCLPATFCWGQEVPGPAGPAACCHPAAVLPARHCQGLPLPCHGCDTCHCLWVPARHACLPASCALPGCCHCHHAILYQVCLTAYAKQMPAPAAVAAWSAHCWFLYCLDAWAGCPAAACCACLHWFKAPSCLMGLPCLI